MAEVIIKKGEGRSFKAGGLWIYDNEIDRINGEFENGDIVEVLDFDGYFLGKGLCRIRGKKRSILQCYTLSFGESRIRGVNHFSGGIENRISGFTSLLGIFQ